MKLKDIYKLAVLMGIKTDPRGEKNVLAELRELKEKFNKMSKEEKEEFDNESLNNPYSDSRILTGKENQDVKEILIGIDVGTEEVLLANELNKKGYKIDLILAHHPVGRALLDLYRVMPLQENIFENLGVPINVSEKIMAPRIAEIERALHPANTFRVVRAAELMNFSLVCFHTVADNQVYKYFEDGICKKNFKTVNDIIKEIKTIPEYKEASAKGNPPKIFAGADKSRAGKIVASELTGGTNGSEKIYAKLEQQGVGTILSMHMNEKSRKMAEKHNLNVIVLGHMASDSLGLNLIIDEIEKKGVKVIPCSGYIRIKR